MHKMDGNILGSFKTNIKKNDSNPQFNQMSVFKVTTTELSQIFFKITVYEINDSQEIEIGHFFNFIKQYIVVDVSQKGIAVSLLSKLLLGKASSNE